MEKLVTDIAVGDKIAIAFFKKYNESEVYQTDLKPFRHAFTLQPDEVVDVQVDEKRQGVDMQLAKTGMHFVSFHAGSVPNFVLII